jgi:hypothetical protein
VADARHDAAGGDLRGCYSQHTSSKAYHQWLPPSATTGGKNMQLGRGSTLCGSTLTIRRYHPVQGSGMPDWRLSAAHKHDHRPQIARLLNAK